MNHSKIEHVLAVLTLAHDEAAGAVVVGGCVGRAWPAAGLSPLWLVGARWTLLALLCVAVVHVARLTRYLGKNNF